MTPLEILERSCFAYAMPSDRLCGVYLLVHEGEVVYVGSTLDMETRINWHFYGRDPRATKKRFDRVLWIEIPAHELEAHEGALIRSLRPMHNRRSPGPRGRDRDILESLGLPVHDEVEASKDFKKSRYLPHSNPPRRRGVTPIRPGKPRRQRHQPSATTPEAKSGIGGAA